MLFDGQVATHEGTTKANQHRCNHQLGIVVKVVMVRQREEGAETAKPGGSKPEYLLGIYVHM
jgi:hypothetical protein